MTTAAPVRLCVSVLMAPEMGPLILLCFFCLQIGLDFTPWCAPTQQDRDEQMTVFIKQLNIAKELDLPV